MKLILSTIIFFLSFLTFAQTKIKYSEKKLSETGITYFRCLNSWPQTAFIGNVADKQLKLTTSHVNGTAYMPIKYGVVVPNDIFNIQTASHHLQTMGDHNTFSFPIENCSMFSEKQIYCYRGDSQNFSGRKFEAMTFVTSEITENFRGQDYKQIKAVLSVNVEGHAPVQDIVMFYEQHECKFE